MWSQVCMLAHEPIRDTGSLLCGPALTLGHHLILCYVTAVLCVVNVNSQGEVKGCVLTSVAES